MVKCKHMTVEEVLNKVDDDKKPIMDKLRGLIRTALPKAVETVRHERITYTLNDKDFAGIRLTKQHVDLLFLIGASLSSPHLKGQGTIGDPKHMEVHSLKHFEEAEAKRLLMEGAASVSA